MRQYLVRFTSAGVLASAFVFMAACGQDAPEDQRDVALPPPAATQPQLQDVPAGTKAPAPRPPARTTPPTQPPPAVSPPTTPPSLPAPASTFGTVSAGTELGVRSTVKMCTNTHHVGDRVVATVAEAVEGTNGTSIPAGATATLQVVESLHGKNDANKVRFTFKVVSVAFGGNTYDLGNTDLVSVPVTKVRRQSTGEQATKVATGAAIGAVVGKVIGKSTTATVVGGVVGAAGGAAAAQGTADYDGCVAPTARIVVRLTEPLRIRLAH